MDLNIVLVGFMGAGKSSIGKILADMLGYRFEDIDSIVENEQGCTISDIFFYAGEAFFREQEKKVLQGLLNTKRLILATGGGIIVEEGNIELLKQIGRVYYLNATPELIFSRIKNSSTRPLLNEMEDKLQGIKDLYKLRDPLYRQADAVVDITTIDKKKIAKLITDDFKTHNK